MATDEEIRKVAGRKAYGYRLNDSNGTQPLPFEVKDHVTREGDRSTEFRGEEGALR